MTPNIDSQACFAPDYAAARTRFNAACADLGITSKAYANPNVGPAGEALATDAAWFGPVEAPRVLALVSGTHGVEGFCGAAAQLDWLHHGGPGALPGGVAVLLIHAINPHGFAWLRRVTEEGVDLNRNWIDFGESLPENRDYDDLADAIVPGALTGPVFDAAEARLAAWRAEHGELAFQVALNAGQFTQPSGLFYGGTGPSWARRTLEQIIEDDRLAQRDLVAVIDFHTGLGRYGTGEPICGHRPGTPGQAMTRTWYGDSLTEPFLGTSSSVPIVGLSQYGWLRALGDRVAFIALEFGTHEPETTFQALRADHWLHTQSDPKRGDLKWNAPETQRIKAQLRRAYYPAKEDWHELVIFRSRQVIRQALTGMAPAAVCTARSWRSTSWSFRSS